MQISKFEELLEEEGVEIMKVQISKFEELVIFCGISFRYLGMI